MSITTLIAKIRTRMADKASLNKVLPGETFTDIAIEACIEGAVEDFNIVECAPPMSRTADTVPFEILFAGTCAKLIEMEKHNAKRNSIGYSEGGTSFDYYRSKDQSLSELLSLYTMDFKKKTRMYKSRINANNFMGPTGQ